MKRLLRLLTTSFVLPAACLMLAACAQGEPANEQTNAAVLGSTGEGSNIQTFDVRRGNARLSVQVFNRGGGVRTFAVSTRSFRKIDRGDSRLAYDAAFEAAQKIDCVGGPAAVDPGSAVFQEEGRRSAFTNGEAAWIFQGRCGA